VVPQLDRALHSQKHLQCHSGFTWTFQDVFESMGVNPHRLEDAKNSHDDVSKSRHGHGHCRHIPPGHLGMPSPAATSLRAEYGDSGLRQIVASERMRLWLRGVAGWP
jgi:hypothetical protein